MEDTDTSSTTTKPISTLAHKRKPISLASKRKITKAKAKHEEDQNQTVQLLRYDHDDDDDDEMEGEDEREEVERRIEALQRIVPGGERLGVDKLFEETAGYIMALQCKLKAMRTLATLFQALDKQDNTKFGG